MITLYRCERHPDHTRVTVRCDEADLDALTTILHFAPRASKQSRLFEGGHYAYLRGQWREKSEREALAYLSEHFSPPSVELLVFEGDRHMASDRPAEEWATSLESEIHNQFASRGYVVQQAGSGHEVYRNKAHQILSSSPEVNAYEGVTYRVELTPDYRPRLHADIAYRFDLDGRLANYKEIQARLEGQGDALAHLKALVTRSTDEIFELASRFVKSIAPLSVANGCCFNSIPLAAQELGLETWLWAHHAPIQIEVGRQEKVALALDISKYDLGFYASPADPIVCVVVHPSHGASKWCSFADWSGVRDIVRKRLTSMIAEAAQVPILLVEYPAPASGNEAEVLRACETKLQKFKNRTPLFLIAVPPEESRDTSDLALRATDSFCGRLDRRLRRLRRGGYTLPLGWDKLASAYERPYVIENAVLKGLTVLGAIPWRISGIARNDGEVSDDICFIGVDVNIQRDVPVVGGVVLDGRGVLQGSHLERLDAPDGDQIDVGSFSHLIGELLERYQTVTGLQPRHVVIHRDGLVGDEAERVLDAAARSGTDCDLIELTKSGAPRMKQTGNRAGTPSKDIAIGSEQNGIAYLNNTLVTGETLANGGFVFPAPRTLAIRRMAGNTPIRILAAQVYALSCAYYGSYRRTGRLPATIAYADSLVNHAAWPISPGTPAYWL